MNYKSQLKGWAVDRIIEWMKASGEKLNMAQLQTQADALAAYAYDDEGDFNDAIGRVTKFLKSSPDAKEKCEQLIAELSYIQEDIERQTALRMSVNGSATPKEAIQ